MKKSLGSRASKAKYMTLEDVFGNKTDFIKALAYEHDVPTFSESLKYLFTVAEVVSISYLSVLLCSRLGRDQR